MRSNLSSSIRPIRNRNDLETALARIEALASSNSGGEHDDELEVLIALVEHFESNAVEISPPDPVSAIKFRMEQLSLTPRDLEPYIGSRARVSEVLSGKRPLSIEMMRAIHHGLGVPYASLMSERSATSRARLGHDAALTRLSNMGFSVSAETASNFIFEAMDRLATPALLRKTRSIRATTKTDHSALLLWQAAALRLAAHNPPANQFAPSQLDREALRRIAQLSSKKGGPLVAAERLREMGLSLVALPALPGTFLDGAAMSSPTGHAVVAITLRHDRTDNFWFTLMHELSHIHLHWEKLSKEHEAFFDDLDIRSEDQFEKEADELAQECLIPRALLRTVRWSLETSIDDLQALASRARVHVAVCAGRWQRDHQNYRRFARLLERNSTRVLFMHGR